MKRILTKAERVSTIQEMHDTACELGAKCKAAEGKQAVSTTRFTEAPPPSSPGLPVNPNASAKEILEAINRLLAEAATRLGRLGTQTPLEGPRAGKPQQSTMTPAELETGIRAWPHVFTEEDAVDVQYGGLATTPELEAERRRRAEARRR
jgi:hypothetical protein